MALTKTPICDFGKKAEDFKLQSINNKSVSLEEIKGKNGTLIMFICNHCPYVRSIETKIANETKRLKGLNVNFVTNLLKGTKHLPPKYFCP